MSIQSNVQSFKIVLPVLETVVLRISRNGAQLFPVATQNLRIERVFAATTVTQRLHDGINLLFENFRQLSM
jgi:hypothetical protein